MPRPRFEPTAEQRKTVEIMAAYGMPEEQIASTTGPHGISPKTLRKYFRRELLLGATKANSKVAETGYQMATSGKQQQAASLCDDEHPDRIGCIGEELVRIYMRRAAPPIQPAAIEQRTMRGVLASVRIQAQFDILDEDGMIIAINTARNAPSRIDQMHRFELTTCYRLAHGASGVVRSDTLV